MARIRKQEKLAKPQFVAIATGLAGSFIGVIRVICGGAGMKSATLSLN
jgi:hypothetical protein